MKKSFLVLLTLGMLLGLMWCSPHKDSSQSKTIYVLAAASLQDSFTEIQKNFEQATGIKLILNFAGSGTLQKQIEEGAPCDVFISAAPKQMDALVAKNLMDRGSSIDLLRNRLVLIVSEAYKDKIASASDLADQDIRVSIGDPEVVPAGQYAKDSLVYLNLWEGIQHKIVFAKDVRQVMAYVERGEVDAGIIYRSDAVHLKSSFIKETFDEEWHNPIVYPAAMATDSKEKDAAARFLSFIQNEESIKIFEKNGFEFNKKVE
ncbi:molybdate transport system substrate-binding protein [Anaerosolibacter carboniphilus]|uniref:Molybdate transport system substrate-binding protein n=1 Tax=Anaerosolibacter carboniphilus TaxID=1417629 RepID=A0A841KTI6_9FIRM|nr:molybdate ABC transporter substrate-binding protein [Anaerosolibacter carboniphilus]MBB6216906.1 molybdate transport system substrate-binding protein [Anaerosolibacter carboniphilus]